MKKLLVAGLLSAVAVFGTGCSDACEKAANAIEDKYEECDVDLGDGGDDEGEEAECTDEAAEAAEKIEECIDKASCDDVKSGAWLTEC